MKPTTLLEFAKREVQQDGSLKVLWGKLNEAGYAALDSVKVTLKAFDFDIFEIKFNLPLKEEVIKQFIDYPYFTEGTVVKIKAGYSDYPETIKELMTGLIIGTKVSLKSDSAQLYLVGVDASIVLKAPIIDAAALKNIAKNIGLKDPVSLVKAILDNAKAPYAEMKASANIPNFGLNYDSESIPPIDSKDREYKSWKTGSTLKKFSNKDITSAEYGLSDKPNITEYVNLLSEQANGFQLRTTYLETIHSLEVLTGRLFWYDSLEQKCYFKTPYQISHNSPGDYKDFYFTSDPTLPITKRIIEFSSDFLSVDSNWSLASNLVVMSKTLGTTGERVEAQVLTHVSNTNSIARTVLMTDKGKEVPLGSLENPVSGKGTFTFLESGWLKKKHISPDAYEMITPNGTEFKIKEFCIEAEMQIIGNPNLRPHDYLYVGGVGNKYSHFWVIDAVDHVISVEGDFITNCSLKSNVIGVPKGLEYENSKEVTGFSKIKAASPIPKTKNTIDPKKAIGIKVPEKTLNKIKRMNRTSNTKINLSNKG